MGDFSRDQQNAYVCGHPLWRMVKCEHPLKPLPHSKGFWMVPLGCQDKVKLVKCGLVIFKATIVTTLTSSDWQACNDLFQLAAWQTTERKTGLYWQTPFKSYRKHNRNMVDFTSDFWFTFIVVYMEGSHFEVRNISK